MESISTLVKTVIVVSFVWSIAESVLPDSSLSRYTKYVYGLLVMTVLVSAIVNINYKNIVMDYSVLYESSDYTEGYLIRVYEENLEKILSQKFDDKMIDVTLNSDYKVTGIKCPDAQTYDEIMRYLNE